MNWKSKRVLVTGAGGFIGSHLTEHLVALGAKTRALVHYNALGSQGWLNHIDSQKSLEVVAGDICDSECVLRAMDGIDVVFHLAALIAIPYSYSAPTSYLRTNVEGTLNVLQAARKLKTDRIIHTSTSEVYGTARYVPIDESHPLQGQSPYSASKIAADKIVEAFYLSFDVPVVTVRPFNTFGPRQSGRAVIPSIILQCLTGKTVHLGHLHPTRDFNYVSNTVDGYLAAASSPKAVGKVYNLGSGREISIEDLFRLISRLTKSFAKLKSEKRRTRPQKSEVERLLADNTLARADLKWAPEVHLEDGLKRTISWLKKNLHQYRPSDYTI
jgi:NAD dependent epimerase/dehydratase